MENLGNSKPGRLPRPPRCMLQEIKAAGYGEGVRWVSSGCESLATRWTVGISADMRLVYSNALTYNWDAEQECHVAAKQALVVMET